MGLKGFYYFTEQYRDDKAKAITSLNLSTLSLTVPASLRNIGAKPYHTQILSRRLLGSKILTGSEIPITLCPEKTLAAA